MKKINTILIALFSMIHLSSTSQTWLAMSGGLGVSTQSVKAIAVDPLGNIYVGGSFTGAINYLAMWNGTSWVNLGSGFDGPIYSIGIKTASDIYIGGSFTNAGGIPANNIVHYVGASWSAIDSGFNGQVNCVYVTGTGDVYAGGQFTTSGNTTLNHIAKYVGGQWTTLGSGIGGVVNSVMLNNSILYAGTEILNSPLQKFENNSWSAIAGISNGRIYALTSFKNNLYTGGDFQLPYYAAARWDGSSWSSITTVFGPTHKIYSFLNRKDSILYIGGNFTGVGIGSPNYIGKIEGLINSPVKKFTVSSDLSGGEVYAIGNVNGKVVAGGKFTSPTSNIAITSTTVGIGEINNLVTDKNFFPNPANGKAFLNISTNEKLKNPDLKVFDLQSRIIKNITFEKYLNSNEIEFIIDCNSLLSGNYFYMISDEDKTILTEKFIVIHD